jgi:hypothetical protein
VIYVGPYDTNKIIKMAEVAINEEGQEGIVVRNASSFKYNDFDMNIAKYVRENHVQTDKHWSHSEIVKNTLIC